jgi:hypothetical protein
MCRRSFVFTVRNASFGIIPVEVIELQLPSTLATAIVHRLIRSGIVQPSGLLETCIFIVNIWVRE